MFAVGSICLLCYVPYERYGAKYPSFPRRLLYNKTFMTAIVIDVRLSSTLLPYTALY